MEDEKVEWHHWLSGYEFEQAPGVGDGQEAWHAAKAHGVTKSYTRLSNWAEMTYDGILFSLEKEENSVICYKMDKSWGHYAQKYN